MTPEMPVMYLVRLEGSELLEQWFNQRDGCGEWIFADLLTRGINGPSKYLLIIDNVRLTRLP
jgi:hypothetical protein